MYKPGNVSRPPPFLTPHQPRLDWQMWFAALGPHTHSPWFTGLVLRLLQGKEPGEGWAGLGWAGRGARKGKTSSNPCYPLLPGHSDPTSPEPCCQLPLS